LYSKENKMPDEIVIPPTTPPIVEPPAPIVAIPPDVLSAAITEALKPMKENMDRMVSQRDEALQEKARLENEIAEAKIQALKDSGQLVEAAEMALAAEKAARAELEARNVALTRDRDVHAALMEVTFQSPRAEVSASREIIEGLVKNEQGMWVDKQGRGIREVVTAFVQDPGNDYLLAPKVNTGPGLGPITPPTQEPVSILERPVTDVLAAAEAGKLQRTGKSIR
jgi:hypothetical protein